MHFAILITTPDYAGLNIKENLLELYPFKKIEGSFEDREIYQLDNVYIYTSEKKCIHCEDFDKEIDADVFIIPTTHRAAAGVQSFTVHAPGNWSEDTSLGGKPRKLCTAPARLLRACYFALKKYSGDTKHEIVMEATHHGPYLEKPCLFIEIGSNEESWKNKDNGKIVAQALMEAIQNPLPESKVAIGIGGPHYCPNFIKIMEKENIAVGHVCSKHNLEHLDEYMLRQAIERTMEKVDYILVDWKGLGEHKERIKTLLEKMPVEWKKVKEI